MKAIEVYAGVGGLGIGLEAAGIQVVHGHDIDEKVHRVRTENGFPGWRADAGDISKIGPRITGYDIVCGGPPCQEYSVAGKGILGERAELTVSYALLIGATRPEWFLYENVRQAAKSPQYQQARKLWKKYGYGLTEIVLDCSLYGVPQKRKRFIVIGRLHERDGFLESAIKAAAATSPKVLSEILDPKDPDDAELIRIGGYFTRPFGDGRGVRRLDEPAPTVYRTFRQGPYGKHRETPNPLDHIPATEAHILTQQQMSRIQGFPKDFDWYSGGAKPEEIDLMIANAIPPSLGYYLGRVIRDRHAGKSMPTIDPRFRKWLEKRTSSRSKKKLSPAVVANITSRLNRARKILDGRTFDNIDAEIAALEASKSFKPLDIKQKSDLRSALRLYSEWRQKFPFKSSYDRPPKPWRSFRLFGRRETPWEPQWVAEHDMVPDPPPKSITPAKLGIPRLNLNAPAKHRNRTEDYPDRYVSRPLTPEEIEEVYGD
ncbi:DNA cytosine methyltransferase [Rhizobium sp. CNPSo 3968]|uniref:DNA cytosine methyltransferase n=1 Tax=Rhizobium sp. CNPSo 3968 TaxID=3021408 RepID=UPI00146A9ECC|nr:DNA cytosine methyltransferase [Rhizobium sp. CNPSo 3968]MDK4723110.1 DNA cytosine methyltransferase [Rhizobium sp. CNPSo 3968]